MRSSWPRLSIYVLAVALFGAASANVPWLSPDQALRAVARDDADVAACLKKDPKALREGVSVKSISELRRLALVEIQAPCVCGAQNCPFWVYRVDGTDARQALASFAIAVTTEPRGSGWPDVIATAHSSALITAGTRYAGQDGKYVPIASWRVRNDTNARKSDIPVRFVPGVSSAKLAGTISLDWGDVYTFVAQAGQQLTITGATPSGLALFLTQNADDGAASVTVVSGKSLALPVSGSYRLSVDPPPAATGNVRYALIFSIR
ncbi:MAG: hypothetical protein JO359_09580 [Candidatus Eremiobacteraeota bacterium]|nr:hypothetical protein [Candidatus Eremiobacteraeota bacterium]